MVVTEEGIGRFRFYRFENKETAQSYFNDAWHCCVILNDKGEEQAARGWNPRTLAAIRKEIWLNTKKEDSL